MSEETRHDQEWRDSQPVAEPESTVEKFRAALERAQKRADQRSSDLPRSPSPHP